MYIKGQIIKIIIDIAKAITPPNLFGIERKIAYAMRKYHSGWIWTGVTNGLAGIKFSGSPNAQGKKKQMIINNKIITIKPNTSLKEKYGWNEILSKFLLIPKGLFLPVWWRNNKCTILIPAITNGSKKCNEKNRVRVALSTANPPHIHMTKSLPIYGIAENKLVITVAPQKDICPHGNTYPKKAVAITNNKITTPTIHVCVKK